MRKPSPFRILQPEIKGDQDILLKLYHVGESLKSLSVHLRSHAPKACSYAVKNWANAFSIVNNVAQAELITGRSERANRLFRRVNRAWSLLEKRCIR